MRRRIIDNSTTTRQELETTLLMVLAIQEKLITFPPTTTMNRSRYYNYSSWEDVVQHDVCATHPTIEEAANNLLVP